MPFVGAAIAGAIGATGIGATIVGGLINVGLSVGLSYVAKSLQGNKPPVAEATESTGFVSRLEAGANRPRSFIVGRWATAGSLGYAGTYGTAGKTPNAFYVQRIDLSDLPVEGMVQLLVNGAPVAYDPSANQGVSGPGYAVPDYVVDGQPYLWIRFHDGRQTTPDQYLRNNFGSDPNYPYTADMVGNGVAYVVVTMLVNGELFASEPEFLFVLDGVRLYDPRKDSTAGGSGAHRFANQATWQHTHNPVDIAYNLLRGISYGGKWVYGCQTVTAAGLPFSSWAAAMNACDALLPNGAVTYKCGGEIFVNTEPGDEVEALAKACNARLAEIGGTYKIHVGAAGASVLSITDASILSTEEQVATLFESIDTTVNGITAKFISPADGWTVKDAPPRYSATYQTEDGGRRVVADIDYGRVPYAGQVQRLMKSALLEERRAKKHAIVLPPSAWALEPLDFISWTSTRNSYSSKLFRVDRVEDKDNLDVALVLTEVDATDYNWTEGSDLLPTSDTAVALLRPAAQAPAGFAASPIKLTGGNGAELAAIRLGWDPSVEDVQAVLYQVRYAAGQATALAGETTHVSLGVADISQNILPQTNYEVRGRFRPKSDRVTTWSSWLPVTTPLAGSDAQTLVNQERDARIEADNAKADAASVSKLVANWEPMAGQWKFDLFEDTAAYTRWGVYLKVGVNWRPAGFFIDQVKATGLSRVFFDVNQFAVGRTGATGASALPLFISGAGLVTIQAAHIKNLDADNLLPGAVTSVRQFFNAASATLAKTGIRAQSASVKVVIASVTLPTIGGDVSIDGSFRLQDTLSSVASLTDDGGRCDLILMRDAAVLYQRTLPFRVRADANVSDVTTKVFINADQMATVAFLDSPPAGTRVYKLVVGLWNKANANRGYKFVVSVSLLRAIELRR